MRNLNRIFIATVALCAAAIATPAMAEVKIGSIRANEIVRDSPQFKAMEAKMRADFERRANEIKAESKTFEEDVKKFQREADIMAPADRAKAEKELNTRRIDIGYKQRQFQEDVQRREQELTAEMLGKIKDVIETVAKKEGLDLVVQDPVYAADKIDITAAVLKQLAK